MLGDQALERFLEYEEVQSVLDVGCGRGAHAEILRAAGRRVTTVDRASAANVAGDYMTYAPPAPFDGIWCCHVLEHQRDVGAFLDKLRGDLKPGGVLAITVPPLKTALVGGHLSLWTEGLLIYHLVLAGFDCAAARIGVYGYNLSAIVRRLDRRHRTLFHGRGDLERLARYFPVPVAQGRDGRFGPVRW